MLVWWVLEKLGIICCIYNVILLHVILLSHLFGYGKPEEGNISHDPDSPFLDEVNVFGLLVLSNDHGIGLQDAHVGLAGQDQKDVGIQLIKEIQRFQELNGDVQLLEHRLLDVFYES